MSHKKYASPHENAIIGKLWPIVKTINIHAEESNLGLYDVTENPPGRIYQASQRCDFKFLCINPNCTCGFFDLFDEVSNMVHDKEIKRKDVKKCSGNEKRCCNRRCLSKLAFEIEIEYTDAG